MIPTTRAQVGPAAQSKVRDVVRSLRSMGVAPLVVAAYVAAVAFAYRKMMRDIFGIGTRRVAALGRKQLRLSREEEQLLPCLVDPDGIAGGFATVGGHAGAKRVLTEAVVWPFHHPEHFQSTAAALPTGLLLSGLPGTGKTLLARALAKELDAFFLEVTVERLFSRYVGESERLAAAVFSLAEKLGRCVIFVDEIDSLLSRRSDDDNAVYAHAKSIFLTKWDGLSTAMDPERAVLVIGATNRPRSLDDAVLRRMPVDVPVNPPGPEQRTNILAILLRAQGLLPDPSEPAVAHPTEPTATPTTALEATAAPDDGGDSTDTSTVPATAAPDAPAAAESTPVAPVAPAGPAEDPEDPMAGVPPAVAKLIGEVARAADGYTGSDLKEVVKMACTTAVGRVIAAGRPSRAPRRRQEAPRARWLSWLPFSAPPPAPKAPPPPPRVMPNRGDFSEAMARVRPSVPVSLRII